MEGHTRLSFEDAVMVEGEPAWKRMGKIARLCSAAVERHFGETLDFTPESIKVLDRVILSGWGKTKRIDEIPLHVRLSFGAYVGEILVRKTPGRWVSGLNEEEPASILFLDDKDEALVNISPFLMVREKLANPWKYDLSLAWAVLDQKLKEIGAR
ncbi:MAG: hypothetical protein J4G05_10130 [Chlorobi bacterium]|nr:hypothetical protein [Chlorobiota bacterium]